MVSSSIYAINESAPAEWKPGEDLAAISFVTLSFYLFLDVQFSIYRVFRKKRGLYFWSMLLGIWGCLLDSVGVVLKHFVPNTEHLWPLYTLFIVGGWTIYAPAQSLVLYSRLHLVNRDQRLQRGVLITIIAVAILMIVPSWVVDWQAYNSHDSHLSSLYSPREAIVDRYNQIGYTLVECLISAIYISSLIILLKLKSSVKQRRVMTDLIYVNGAVVSFDILTVILVFLNQTGISHPIQTCSYILKFKLEFMVLNQLMAVAARGIQKDSFAERRYHHPAISSEKESSSRSAASTKTPRGRIESFPDESTPGSVQELVVPSHALSKAQVIHDESHPQNIQDRADLGEWPLRAKIKEYRGNETDEEEDEDIGVHMWGRRGNMVMEVPWFREEHHN